MSTDLRSRLIRLAHAQPELRGHLLPLLKQGGAGSERARKNFAQAERGIEQGVSHLMSAVESFTDALGNLKAGNAYISDPDTEHGEKMLAALIPQIQNLAVRGELRGTLEAVRSTREDLELQIQTLL